MFKLHRLPKEFIQKLLLNKSTTGPVNLLLPVQNVNKLYSTLPDIQSTVYSENTHQKKTYTLSSYDTRFFEDHKDSFSREAAFFKMEDFERSDLSIYSFNYIFRVLAKNPGRNLKFAETIFYKLLLGKYAARATSDSYIMMFKFYALLRKPNEAEKIYVKMLKDPDITLVSGSFNALLTVYEKSHVSVEKMVKILKDFDEHNVQPDSYTFYILLSGCQQSLDLERSKTLFDEMKKRNLKPTIFCYNVYLKLLNNLNLPYSEVLDYFSKIVQSGVKPDQFSYGILIRMCLNQQAEKQAFLLFDEMIKMGLEPSINTITLLKMTPFQFLAKLKHLGAKASPNLYNSLLDVSVKTNNFIEAFKITTDMHENSIAPSVYSYSILMEAYVKMGKSEKALQLYQELKERNLSPDAHIYRSLIEAIGADGDIEKVIELLEEARSFDIRGNYHLYNTALGACAKTQNQTGAEQLLVMLKEDGQIPNSHIYNSMLSIYGSGNNFSSVWQLYKEMLSCNVSPDPVTYKLMLQYCCNQMDYIKALKIFKEMIDSKDTFPTSKDFVELLKLLLTQNKLTEAFEIWFSYVSSPWASIRDEGVALFLHLCQLRNSHRTALSTFDGFKARITSHALKPFTLHPATYLVYLRLLAENKMYNAFFTALRDAEDLYSVQFNRKHLIILKKHFESSPENQKRFASVWSTLPEGTFQPSDVPSYARLPLGLHAHSHDFDD